MSETNAGDEIPQLTPPEAVKVMADGDRCVLLDVRSKLEFDYVGHPQGAINIPWQEPPAWEVVPDFVEKVRQRLAALNHSVPPESLTILTLCRSGARSNDAGRELARNGFTRVINISEGFEGRLNENRHRGELGGWRFHGLPWEQT